MIHRWYLPKPSGRSAPIPNEPILFFRPRHPCFRNTQMKREAIFSFSISSTSRRTVLTITTVLDALMEITTSLKCSCNTDTQNSMHDSTMPSGSVAVMRHDAVWTENRGFTPMRMAVWFSLQIFRKGTKRARIFLFLAHTLRQCIPVSGKYVRVYIVSQLMRTFSAYSRHISHFGIEMHIGYQRVSYP